MKARNTMVDFHRAATQSVTCPICDTKPGQHCHQRRKRPTRETHQARVIVWEKAIALATRLNKPRSQS